MVFLQITSILALAKLASAQYDYVSECPQENGFFADALQCDRYYECVDGEVLEKLCPDGLVFDETSHSYAKCSFPFSIDCTGREELQPAQKSSDKCPRLNGYFADPDPDVCNVFHYCVDGAPNKVTCPSDLIFDPEKGQCGWSDQTNRIGCRSQDLLSFQCPDQSSPAEHSRHPDPEDCTTFFLCIGGKARQSKCGQGLIYNSDTSSCERQSTAPPGPCQTWFNETYLETIFPPREALTQEVLERRKKLPQRTRTQGSSFERRRPQAPQQNFISRRPQEEEIVQLPPQLAALAENSELGFQSRPSRPRPAENTIRDDFKTSFVQNLQGRRPSKFTTTTRAPFTRPPLRDTNIRPAPQRTQSFNSNRQQQTSSDVSTGFGRRRNPERVPERLDIENLGSLGPSQLDAFLQNQNSERLIPTAQAVPTAPTVPPRSFDAVSSGSSSAASDFQSRRRVPLSRGSTSRRQQEQATSQESSSRDTEILRRPQLRRRPVARRPSQADRQVAETADTDVPLQRGGSGSKRRVAVRRGQTSSRRGAASSNDNDFPSFTANTGRRGDNSRLEVTQLNQLPSLRPVEEDEGEFGSFSSLRQRSRGRQSRARKTRRRKENSE